MSGAQHTPGPWQALYVGCEKAVIIGTADGETGFARMQSFDGTPSAEEQEANARLIAAAPDLLATLKMVREGFGHGIPFAESEVRARIDAALAKAEGRS